MFFSICAAFYIFASKMVLRVNSNMGSGRLGGGGGKSKKGHTIMTLARRVTSVQPGLKLHHTTTTMVGRATSVHAWDTFQSKTTFSDVLSRYSYSLIHPTLHPFPCFIHPTHATLVGLGEAKFHPPKQPESKSRWTFVSVTIFCMCCQRRFLHREHVNILLVG